MAKTDPKDVDYQRYAITAFGGGIGAAAGFALVHWSGMQLDFVPSAVIEAIGCGMGASVAETIDNGLSTEKAFAAMKSMSVVGTIALLYFGLGLLPLERMLNLNTAILGPSIKGLVAGAAGHYLILTGQIKYATTTTK